MFDPHEVAEAQRRAAAERLKVKREIRMDRRPGRDALVAQMEQAQAALDAYDAETAELLEHFPLIQAARENRKAAINEYNETLREGAPLIQAADPRPGKMGREAEDAQGRIVSAMAELAELHEISEFDEY